MINLINKIVIPGILFYVMASLWHEHDVFLCVI